MNSLKLEPPLSDSLARLVEGVRRSAPRTAEDAVDRLTDSHIDPSDLRPWLDYDHPTRDSYGRKLVARGRNFELMVMSWAPGDFSAIHDHGVAQWGAVLYLGAADHVVFGLEHDVLRIRRRMTTHAGLVYPVDASLIHLMGNSTDAPFLSLHLYGRERSSSSITGDARIFDLWEERIQRTDGGVFHCLPEDDITWREPCPVADLDTTLLHHQLMLDRVVRIAREDSGFTPRADALRRRIADLESTRDLKVAL